MDPDALLDCSVAPVPYFKARLSYLSLQPKKGPYLPITTFTFFGLSNSTSQPLSIPIRWDYTVVIPSRSAGALRAMAVRHEHLFANWTTQKQMGTSGRIRTIEAILTD